MSHNEQITRIKEKLTLAQAVSENRKVFGASSHQYQIHKPLTNAGIDEFEQINHLTLPRSFRLFLTEIGNGGAGPYYGIYQLNTTNKNPFLAQPCRLYKNMTQEKWDELIDSYDDDDEDFQDSIFQGMLSIGTQGCTYETMLILNGEHAGRIIYIDYELSIPFLTYEDHFLDWYERWLDEVNNGYEISWFGMNMSGDDQELIQKFHANNNLAFQEQAILGMHKLPQLAESTIDFLEDQCKHSSFRIKKASLALLAKHHYQKAKPYLAQFITSQKEEEQLTSLQYLFWYAKDHGSDWIDEIRTILKTNKNDEISKYANYILDHIHK